jgi:hypothetical protein
LTAVSLYGPYVLQNAATATGTGTPFVTGGFATACLSVTGPFTASITVEVQGADSNWRAIDLITQPGNYRYDVTSYNAIRANITSYTSGSVTVMGTAQALVSEGLTSNTQGILLPSVARTATTPSPIQTNYGARGVALTINVTSYQSGGAGITPQFYIVDPASGASSQLAAGNAITTTGIYTWLIYPGTTTGGYKSSSFQVPRHWYLNMFHGDSYSYTYSVGYAYTI